MYNAISLYALRAFAPKEMLRIVNHNKQCEAHAPNLATVTFNDVVHWSQEIDLTGDLPTVANIVEFPRNIGLLRVSCIQPPFLSLYVV